jgi:hypothetical protein
MMRDDSLRTMLFAAILLAVASVRAEEPWHHLNDGAIRSAFSGRELTDKSRFKHLYLVDGTLRGVESGRPFEGRWRVERDELCLARVPETTYECFEVQKKGTEFRFLQDGYVIFQGKLNAVGKPMNRVPAR